MLCCNGALTFSCNFDNLKSFNSGGILMNRYLFVIDYQNDFVDGALGFPGAELLDSKIAAKVRSYGAGKVLFTRDTHFENYLSTREGKNLPIVHCIQGTPGWEVYGNTA